MISLVASSMPMIQIVPDMTIELDLRVEVPDWRSIETLDHLCQTALDAAAALETASGEVSLLLTDDAEMQSLNAAWRGKDKPTDVLSFPADPIDAPFLGDIAVGAGIATRDAETQGKPLSDHLRHLVIHGFLHLLGHDHEEDTQAVEMEALERQALASLGLPDPYRFRI